MKTLVLASVFALAFAWAWTASPAFSDPAAPAGSPAPVVTPEPPLAGLAIGLYMPDFTLGTSDGSTLALHDIPSNALVVNFFATWCPPCRDETAAFLKVAGQVAPSGIKFVGVDNERVDVVKKYMTARNMTEYPVMIDADSKIQDRLGVHAYPTTIIVGNDGIIRFMVEGGLTEAGLSEAIDAATGVLTAAPQLDDIDHISATPQATFTYDLQRAGTQPGSGTLVIEVFARAFDYTGVRVVEHWSGSASEVRLYGSVSPDGALDFGWQQFDATTAAVLSLFAKQLMHGRDTSIGQEWTQTRSSHHTMLAARLTITSSADGGMLGLHELGSTVPVGVSAPDGVTFDANVLYDAARSVPVSGTIAKGGGVKAAPVSFSLRKH